MTPEIIRTWIETEKKGKITAIRKSIIKKLNVFSSSLAIDDDDSDNQTLKMRAKALELLSEVWLDYVNSQQWEEDFKAVYMTEFNNTKNIDYDLTGILVEIAATLGLASMYDNIFGDNMLDLNLIEEKMIAQWGNVFNEDK